jgi:hypothetical protein
MMGAGFSERKVALMPQKLVPVTEEDKKKSYYKYYLEDMVDAPPETL